MSGQAIGQAETLPMWTIYEDPTDFPGEIVARKFVMANGSYAPTYETIKLEHGGIDGFPWPPNMPIERKRALWRESRLRAVRSAIKQLMPGATCLQRNLQDDPKIVETWI